MAGAASGAISPPVAFSTPRRSIMNASPCSCIEGNSGATDCQDRSNAFCLMWIACTGAWHAGRTAGIYGMETVFRE